MMVVVIDRVLELPGPRAAAKHWPPALRLDPQSEARPEGNGTDFPTPVLDGGIGIR